MILGRWNVLVDSVTGICPGELDSQTLAVLRGRMVRYLMRSREITIGRSGKGHQVDIDLSLEGPAHKISRRQATLRYVFAHCVQEMPSGNENRNSRIINYGRLNVDPKKSCFGTKLIAYDTTRIFRCPKQCTLHSALTTYSVYLSQINFIQNIINNKLTLGTSFTYACTNVE